MLSTATTTEAGPATRDNASITIQLPPEVEQYSHDIRRFVDAMVYKLAVHHRKGRWEGLTSESMMNKLAGEAQELYQAIQRGNMIEIMLEAADVANYGLIISAIAMERGK